MNSIVDQIKRVEISIPYNQDTKPIFKKLRIYIADIFGGFTQIKSTNGGFWIDKEGNEYKEDIFLFIIYYKSGNIQEAEEALKLLAKMLIEVGEDESWIIIEEAKRILCSK